MAMMWCSGWQFTLTTIHAIVRRRQRFFPTTMPSSQSHPAGSKCSAGEGRAEQSASLRRGRLPHTRDDTGTRYPSRRHRCLKERNFMSIDLDRKDLINTQQMEVAVNGPDGATHLILCTGVADLGTVSHERYTFLVGPPISRRQFVGAIASGALST